MNIKVDNKLIKKLIGYFNIILGFIYLASPLSYWFAIKNFISPSLNQLNLELNSNQMPSYGITYIFLGIMVIIGGFVLFSGVNILKNKNSNYLKSGVSIAIISIFLYTVLLVLAFFPIVSSIYKMSSSL